MIRSSQGSSFEFSFTNQVAYMLYHSNSVPAYALLLPLRLPYFDSVYKMATSVTPKMPGASLIHFDSLQWNHWILYLASFARWSDPNRGCTDCQWKVLR